MHYHITECNSIITTFFVIVLFFQFEFNTKMKLEIVTIIIAMSIAIVLLDTSGNDTLSRTSFMHSMVWQVNWSYKNPIKPRCKRRTMPPGKTCRRHFLPREKMPKATFS